MPSTSRRCPICRASVERVDPRFLPFCCERCRSADFNAWLNERYSAPVVSRRPLDEAQASNEPTDLDE